ncbi:redoxin domain-containing protein [Solibacillus daqui]|uniref:redoxin domain-containing protein n=1 Tax=Solibacillus daqui TaxID=2912187 RepID=UPI002366777B|nr:redoxin domain-containing protein [Solibacillus daqui]
MKRITQLSLVLLLGLAIVYAIFSNVSQQQVLAKDVTLHSLTGEGQTISASGNVILNFWATYCPPCEREMPALNAVYSNLQAKSVQLYAINVEEPTKIVNQYVKNKDLDFPILLDRSGELKDAYAITTLPTTLFIRDGEVVHTVKGEITEPEIYELTKKYFN